jgi:hypothetical protein
MTDPAELLKRKGTRETVTLIDDGKTARTPVILTVVRPRTRYLDIEALSQTCN